MDNDMNNGVISNVQTRSFRSSTYNLGTNLSGTVSVDCTLGDVQYGKIDKPALGDGAIRLTFCNWPKGTDVIRVTIEVILTVAPGQTISIPLNGDGTVPFGADTLEGYQYNNGNPRINVPAGVTRVHYIFSTIDCGTTLEIMPVDRPRTATQIKWGTPYTVLTGTITANTTSNLITGSGTLFIAELSNNATLRSYDDHTVVYGKLSANAWTNTTLTLQANSTANLSSAKVVVYSSKGILGDRQGDMMTDGGNLYVCTTDWAANTNIWSKTSLGSNSWLQ
jgi:hypothetical protein